MEIQGLVEENYEQEKKHPKIRKCWNCGTNVLKQDERWNKKGNGTIVTSVYKCPTCGFIYEVTP